MTRTDLELATLPFAGAADIEQTAGGLVPHRLPAWARAQSADPRLALVESVPAGVRLRLRTAAAALELDVDLTLVQPLGRDPLPAVFDVVADGRLHGSVSTSEGTRLVVGPGGAFDVVPGPTTTVRLPLPGDPGAVVEVWLPHAAAMCVTAARVPDGAELAPADPLTRRWVHYGSSISHCLEAARPTETWPNAVALRAGLDLRNLGLAGECMLDPFVARTIRDTAADVISLKVGINVLNGATMRERTFVPALHGFLDTIREGHPDTPVVLVSPIICPTAEDAPGPTVAQPDGRFTTVDQPAELTVGALTLRRIRQLVELVATTRQDPHLHLLSGLSLFGEADVEDLYDGLHPNAEGYLRMADRFYAEVFAADGLVPLR